jgi:hypothetical protein
MPVAGPLKSINASIQRFLSAQTQLATLCGTGMLQVTSLATKGALIPVSDYCVRGGEKVASREFEGLIWQLSNGRGSIFFVQIECCFLNLKMKCSRWGEDCFRYLD